MTIFVDTSVWFAAASKRDRNNLLAKSILRSDPDHLVTDHILIETWFLLNSRFGRSIAELFWDQLRRSTVRIEPVTSADIEVAWAIGLAFADQDFSPVDRTSFAVMERLGLTRAASFDHHFAIYRYGRSREKAFEIVSSGPTELFDLFYEAIMARKQITLEYDGLYREVCPHILGHTGRAETALVFQFGGSTRSRLPAEGEWRCLRLSQVTNAKLRDGPWRSGTRHQTIQRCVDKLFIDVNEGVPNQPGRRFR